MIDDKNQHEPVKKEIDEDIVKYYVVEEERRYPPVVILILLTIVGVFIAMGLSFATFKFLDSNETINTIISKLENNDVDDDKDKDKNKDKDKDKYIITYMENTTFESGIMLVNQFPTPDSKGKLFKGEGYVFTFSLLVGKGTKGVYYELTAVPNANNTLRPDYVKLYLEKNGVGVKDSYRDNNKVKVFTDYEDSKHEGTVGKVILKDYITEEDAKKGKIDFVMRMWVSEDAIVDDDYFNKAFSAKVNTYATSAIR